MFKFVATLALFNVVALAVPLPGQVAKSLPTSGGAATRRILGGAETFIEAVPHQVSVQINGKHFCGGSIISEYYVLTAAHCFDYILNAPLSAYTIRAGTRDNTEGGTVHRVVDFIPHERFYQIYYDNDIALYRVYEPFQFDKTRQPVPLYAQDEVPRAGAAAVVSGWGLGPNFNGHILNILEVSIVSKKICSEITPYFVDGQICAEHKERAKKFCKGDSGGPLTVKGRLAGIVSLGSDCVPNEVKSVYAEVGYYRDWIKQHSGV